MGVVTRSTSGRLSAAAHRPSSRQGPLGERREVRDHLLVEGVVDDLGPQDVEQHRPDEVVACADRFGVLVPGGVDPGRDEQPLVQEPELPQPVPAPVTGEQAQQLVELRRERVAVVVRRQQPGRGALVDVEVADHPRQVRDELRRTGTAPDDGHAPVGQLHRVVPGGRVEGRAREALLASDGGKRRTVQLPDRADDAVDDLGRLGAVGGADGQRPLGRGLVEARLGHLAPEADALPQPEVLRRRLEVGQQVGLGREAGDPVVRLGERVAVQLVGHVDPAAGVDILEPRPADVAVLLEHRDRHTGLAQAVRRRQARGARADDGAAKIGSEVGAAPRRSARIGSFERELLTQEPLPLLGRVGANQEPEDAPAFLGGQLVIGAPRGQVTRQGGDRQRTRLGHLIGAKAAPGHEQLFLVRRELLAQQRQVARPVRHRAEQWVHVRRRTRRCYLCRFSSPPMRTSLGRRVPAGGQRPMCLPSSAIWLFTSTVRGSLSMAVARLSAVQRSSVSTESAIDQPA